MREGEDLFWLERRVPPLPFHARVLEMAPKPLRSLVDCGPDARPVVWRLDWAHLGAEERAWIEDGEYLPALGFHWLDRTATLMRWCGRQRWPAALLEVPSRRLTQLSISDLLHVMGSGAWLADAQVALVWGFAHDALVRPRAVRWPLPCRGAVFPYGDGLNVGWWAQAADLTRLG